MKIVTYGKIEVSYEYMELSCQEYSYIKTSIALPDLGTSIPLYMLSVNHPPT